jgi:hypothetical protein
MLAFHVRGWSSANQPRVTTDAALAASASSSTSTRNGAGRFLHERSGITDVAGADRNDLGAGHSDFVVVIAQLRDMLAAVQSAEVPEEHEHGRRLVPYVAESV